MQQHRFFRMDLRGQLETVSMESGVDADGNLVRYQWGAYDGMQKEVGDLYRQFGW